MEAASAGRSRPAYVSVLLRRLSERGLLHLVHRGKPHWEELYVQEAPE